MSKNSNTWFEYSVKAGMNKMAAHHGKEVIDSWEKFWAFNMTDEILAQMTQFGLANPEAAIHRWSLQSGPCPWVPQDSEKALLKKDPRYSPADCK